MKRCLFIVLALFGLNAFAEMHEKGGMDHMSNMMSSEAESGLMGSFSLRYKPIGFDEDADQLTYRARVGWMGDVNEAVKWGVSLSTATEQSFAGVDLQDIKLEQAYIAYSPMESLSIKVGKSGWMPDFHKVGVLYSEQLYTAGAMLKYNVAMSETSNAYVKVGALNLEESDPIADGVTALVKLGGDFDVSDGMTLGVKISALNDALMKEGSESNTLVGASLNLNASMQFPFGVSFNYLANADEFNFDSYTIGLSVGGAGKADSVEMGDFGLGVNYYALNADDVISSWLNEDYVASAGKGVAVRAQYNPWDKSSLVAKYARNLDDDSNNLVAELMFVF